MSYKKEKNMAALNGMKKTSKKREICTKINNNNTNLKNHLCKARSHKDGSKNETDY